MDVCATATVHSYPALLPSSLPRGRRDIRGIFGQQIVLFRRHSTPYLYIICTLWGRGKFVVVKTMRKLIPAKTISKYYANFSEIRSTPPHFQPLLAFVFFPCLSFLLGESLRCTSVFSAVFPSNNYVLCLHLDMWFCLAKKKHTQKALLSPTGFIYRIRQTNRIKEKSWSMRIKTRIRHDASDFVIWFAYFPFRA